jgi:signal transduction histidine kinase
VLESGQPIEREFYYNGEGYDHWFRISIAPLGDDKLLQTFIDLSENHRRRRELETAVEELKRSNERLSEFTHVASHDLKEPLRKVILYANMLEERYGNSLNPQALDYLQRMQQTTYRMQSLINDLLAYAQVSLRPERLEQVPLDVLLQGVLADLETSISSQGGMVRCSELPRVPGDSVQLRQLFQNLISNALKFHREALPPEVDITYKKFKSTDLPAQFSSQAAAKNYAAITIADNGIGFSPDNERKIFQLFQRLHTRTEYEGTGIGLAIVQKVVENHHGFIHATSKPGEGSQFIVYLPLA